MLFLGDYHFFGKLGRELRMMFGWIGCDLRSLDQKERYNKLGWIRKRKRKGYKVRQEQTPMEERELFFCDHV